MVKQFIIRLGMLSVLLACATPVSAANDLRVVESAALGADRNLPWSEPVQIDDPFQGRFIGVFDRHSFNDRFLNTFARIEIQSLWTHDFIRVLSIIRDRDCLSRSLRTSTSSVLSCSEFSNARNIIELFVKLDGEVFQVTGQNSTFAVSDELAQALQNAPDEENISIRLVTDSGETIDSEIGQGTVEAWKTVYQSEGTLVSE